MAINPESQYPGKIAPSSSAYPYGQARNITTPGDGTGTPWEAALVNDIFGFQQELLSEGGLVPSGTPDQVGTSQYYEALRLLTSRRRYVDTVAAKADETLRLGDLIVWAEHTEGRGPEGGNAGLVVPGGTGADDDGSFFDMANGLQIQALFPSGVKDKHFGAVHDNTADDTVAVMASYTYISTEGVPLEICSGDIYITDQGGTGIALDWDGGHSGLRINMKGTFQYKGGTGVALRIGQGPNPIVKSEFNDLSVAATIQAPYENLVGVGIRLVEVGECTFRRPLISGFNEGLSLRPNAAGSAVVGNTFYDIRVEDCYYPIYMEPASEDVCFITNNTFHGGALVTPPAGFSDIVTADAHLISMRNPGRLTNVANTVDGNSFYCVKLEERVTRKVYCEGNGNHFINDYFDAGAYSVGDTHASGNYPYRQSGITGFTSDGSSTITKVGHGLGAYVRKGDLINIDSLATNISDSGNYVVVAVPDADTIQLNKAVTGAGSITIQHLSADIEFSATGNRNVIDSEVAGLQVITSVATKQDNQIRGATRGLVSGAFPPLGTEGNDNYPGGITDAPQPGTINMWVETLGGAGTHNAYLGNINDQDTDANVQLCFGALDGSGRQGVFASIMANKEGRSVSQPHGGLILRTRASGSNSYLVDRLSIDSDGVVSVLGDHVIVANSKTPASAADTGTAGTICWDANFIYVCVATDTWKRVAISTW